MIPNNDYNSLSRRSALRNSLRITSQSKAADLHCHAFGVLHASAPRVSSPWQRHLQLAKRVRTVLVISLCLIVRPLLLPIMYETPCCSRHAC